jgi:hypothetical protein
MDKERIKRFYTKARTLEQEAKKLNDNAECIRNLAENLSGINDFPEEIRKTMLNNVKAGGSYLLKVFNDVIFSGSVMHSNAPDVIRVYAKLGDPLCSKMVEHFGSSLYNAVKGSPIPKLLIRRTMTESQYLGYMCGELSINGTDYLPKTEQVPETA